MRDQTEQIRGRIDGLESEVRRLTRAQIQAFAAVVGSAPAFARWPANERYWYSGSEGVKVTRGEKAALGHLWTRMLAGLAFAVSGEDVEVHVARRTLMGRLDRLAEPRQHVRIEGQATTIVERALGGEVWLGVIGIWNAFCAALLRERLEPALRSDLTYAWRTVMGEDLSVG
jgi:hypothetical protein